MYLCKVRNPGVLLVFLQNKKVYWYKWKNSHEIKKRRFPCFAFIYKFIDTSHMHVHPSLIFIFLIVMEAGAK